MPDETSKPGLSRKMKVRNHCMLPNAINSFMVSNSFGAICGGNLQMFYPWDEIFDEDERPTLRYPAVFKSKDSASRYMYGDRNYMEILESVN